MTDPFPFRVVIDRNTIEVYSGDKVSLLRLQFINSIANMAKGVLALKISGHLSTFFTETISVLISVARQARIRVCMVIEEFIGVHGYMAPRFLAVDVKFLTVKLKDVLSPLAVDLNFSGFVVDKLVPDFHVCPAPFVFGSRT